MKTLGEIIKECELSYEDIITNHRSDYDDAYNIEKDWLINVEQKLSILKDSDDIRNIEDVISKLKNGTYTFEEADTDKLSLFIRRINNVVSITNRINNFKQGTKLDDNTTLNLCDLFNKIKSTDKFKDFNLTLNENLKKFRIHLFSVVKHCQAPNKYPIFYKYWRNLFTNVLNNEDDYDFFCSFYKNNFDEENRHIILGAYFGALGIILAKKITENKIIKEKNDRNYKRIREILNLPRYFDLIKGYKNNQVDENKLDAPPIKNIPEEEFPISNDNPNETTHPLNQILYGPPGTGKTYNTINTALEICGEDLAGKDRKEIKKLFQKYVEEERIVFTTFHQSMTYEDFVEGIKPKINGEDESDISYEIEDGIFKLLCKKAEEENNTSPNNKNFDEAWAELIDDVKRSLSMDKLVKIGSWEYGLSSKESLKYSSINTPSQYSFTITKKNVFDAYRKIKARPSGAFQKDMEEIVVFMKNKFNLNDYQEVSVIEDSANQNYVLIIDEINRGNVSQIFGELITLIEEDKRLGKSEALQVQLPYSKKPFGVPPNIFIIGTMNTADRSVEALDTALRRRFSFTEMPPKPTLIDTVGETENGEVSGVKLSTLLETINKRIEKLLDKDHMIGHSYFLSVKDWEDLKSVFQNKIVPLLQEYFFGDYGKIGLVIGSKFFKDNEQQEDNFFAPFEDYDSSSFVERKVYHLQNIKDMEKDKFEEALNYLLRK